MGGSIGERDFLPGFRHYLYVQVRREVEFRFNNKGSQKRKYGALKIEKIGTGIDSIKKFKLI